MFEILDNFGVEVCDKLLREGIPKLKEQNYSLNDLDIFLIDMVLQQLTPSAATWTAWPQIYKWVREMQNFEQR